jgi:hypothetical protein
LARLFDLPDYHPDRMLAASILLCVELGIIIAVTMWKPLDGGTPVTVELFSR